jgi:hypothetical protein
MVAGETVMPSPCRCQAIVAAPASRPLVVSSTRRFTIRSTTPGSMAVGEPSGRRERGSKAASPPDAVAGQEARHERRRNPVAPGRLGLAQTLQDNSEDARPTFRHRAA